MALLIVIVAELIGFKKVVLGPGVLMMFPFLYAMVIGAFLSWPKLKLRISPFVTGRHKGRMGGDGAMGKGLQWLKTTFRPSGYEGILYETVIAYETYGRLTPEKDNGILVIHGFSSDSHVASHSPDDLGGWWEWMVGPGRSIDTRKFFVVCANNFGSCFGSTGPATLNRKTGKPFGDRFPEPTVGQMVSVLRRLQDEFGISRWNAVIGGSLGGMAALEWAASFPEAVSKAVCLNAGAGLSYMGRGFVELQDEFLRFTGAEGLQLARRLATLAYLGEDFFRAKGLDDPSWSLTAFLAEEARQFSGKFNPFSYRNFLHAMRQFDLDPSATPLATAPFRPSIFVVGCRQDLLFPPHIIDETVRRFSRFARVESLVVSSSYGHDSFLLDEGLYSGIVSRYLSF
ncbi:MAG: alpha/beta fold hydrolase [Actinobacteria bacterium]|nr:alpha/beta fold hydrolase [Actinomycetota bacterium]